MKAKGMSRRPSARRGMRGFAMMEILVTIAIAAVGLLSVAALQVISTRSNHGSFLRGQAVILAYSMADRMRANRLAVTDLNGDYVGFYNSADDDAYQGGINNSCTQTSDTAAEVCSVAEMASHDVSEWTNEVAQGLPNGAGVVCADSSPNDGTAVGDAQCDNAADAPLVVKVWWTEIVPEVGAQTQRFVLGYRS